MCACDPAQVRSLSSHDHRSVRLPTTARLNLGEPEKLCRALQVRPTLFHACEQRPRASIPRCTPPLPHMRRGLCLKSDYTSSIKLPFVVSGACDPARTGCEIARTFLRIADSSLVSGRIGMVIGSFDQASPRPAIELLLQKLSGGVGRLQCWTAPPRTGTGPN